MIREALAALDRLDVARARELWAQVHALEHSTVAICQLGVLDTRLARWEDAAAELSRCVEAMPAPSNPVERGRYEGRRADLAAARQHVAEIHVSPPPDAKQILLDGRDVDAGGAIYVAPGLHEVVATGQQGQRAQATVKVAAGESRHVLLAFERRPPPAMAILPVSAPAGWPASTPSGSMPWIVGTGVTTSLTLLTTGLLLRLDAGNLRDETRMWDIAVIDCMENFQPYEGPLARAKAAHAEERTTRIAGNAALIAGVAVGSATLAYVFLPRGTQIRVQAGGVTVRYLW